MNFGFIQKFFGENIEDENMAVQLCRQMGCEEFASGSCIMKQGDESNDKLYVIIKGKVGIVIAKDTNIFKKVRLQDKRERTISIDYDNVQSVVDSYGTKVNELSKGDGFGEKALLLDPQDAKRNATIIALEDTICITVLRNDFLKILENFNKENQLKEQLLISQMPFLKLITSSSTKEALMLYFKNQSATRGKFLTEEGKLGEDIFILQSGKVVVEKKFQNQNNIYYSEYHTVKLTEISEPTFIGEEILFIDQEIQEVIKSNNHSKHRKKDLSNNDVDAIKGISISSESEDLTQQNYKYTVRVDSLLCKFLIISKSFFLTKFPKEILNEIKQNYIKKEQIRQEVFDQMKNHKITYLNNSKYNVENTYHMINALSNKEIFSQMKPQMIENYNKTLIKKQENIQSNFDKLQMENIEDEFRAIYRPDPEIQAEIIEEKKVLLQQKLKQQNRQKQEEKRQHNASNLRQKSRPSSQNVSPLQSPRDHSNSRLSSPQEEKNKKRQFSGHTNHRSLEAHCQTPLDRLKQKKNEDGSVNIVELAQNVKYNKIQLRDISITDIMGENYNIFDNVEASRLLTIKSEQSKEKRMQLEQLKDEYNAKKAQQIYNKIQKGDVQNLDLGYLNSFKKQQHYKLVQMGKLKLEIKSNIINTQNSLKLSQDLKEKITQMKTKHKEDLEQDTSNLIQNVSYLTPSSQLAKKLQNFTNQPELTQSENFSEYLNSINKSNRQLTNAFSNRSKISYTPQNQQNRSPFNSPTFNTYFSDNLLDQFKICQTPKQNEPDLQGLDQLINSSLNKVKTVNPELSSPKIQYQAFPTRSVFSRDQKFRQSVRAKSQSSIKRPSTSIQQQSQKNTLDNILSKQNIQECPIKTEENSYFFQTNTSQNKKSEENILNTQQSPLFTKKNSTDSYKFAFENMGIFKSDKINIASSQSAYFQPQSNHKRQYSCLSQIGQPDSIQQIYQPPINATKQEQKLAQSSQNFSKNAKNKIESTQSSKFKYNEFLAMKFKQRQQLHPNRDLIKKNYQYFNQDAKSNKTNQLESDYILITK